MSKEDWPEDRTFWYLNLKSELDFGKHKGETVEDVLENDPKYLLWIKEKGIHKFKPEVNKLLKEIK